ncbi:PglZ domain-containing protein [Runella sp.]|uniref:PglZ domain-containing protein n=1 Tax=Runella sp. TaxID=1960881 RepID=UPI00301B4C2E
MLSIFTANRTLRLDDEAEFMDEYHLQGHHRRLVAHYKTDLMTQQARRTLAEILNPADFGEPKLTQGLLSTFLGFQRIEDWSILLIKMITLALEENRTDLNRIVRKVNAYQWNYLLSKRSQKYFGQGFTEFTADVVLEWAECLKYNLLTVEIEERHPQDPYLRLHIKDLPTLNRLRVLAERAKTHTSPKVNGAVQAILEEGAKKIQAIKLVELYGLDSSYPYQNSELQWEILRRLTEQVRIDPRQIPILIEQINATQQAMLDWVTILRNTARFFDLLNGISSYILDTPDAYLHHYTHHWYQADTAYRKSILYFSQLDTTDLPDGFQYEPLRAGLNQSYDSFVEKLNREWLCCLQSHNFEVVQLKTPKSYQFFEREIGALEQKTVVIISDALRYEAARELLDQLYGDPKNDAVIDFQLSSLPSVTAIGMTDLLPGRTVQFVGGEIAKEGISTEGTENRQKVLQTIARDAVAITAKTLDEYTREQTTELFKRKLVYIYQNLIDATGDKKESERKTFREVENAIAELKRLIKQIHTTYNVAKVVHHHIW